MTNLAWKLRVAVLWLFLAVGETVALVMYLYRAETVKGILRSDVAGVDPATAQAQVYTALGVLVPLAMAFATLVLVDRVNRWANGAVGLLTAVTLLSLVLQNLNDPLVLVLAVMLVVAAFVVWHVWQWPQQDTPTSPADASEHSPHRMGAP